MKRSSQKCETRAEESRRSCRKKFLNFTSQLRKKGQASDWRRPRRLWIGIMAQWILSPRLAWVRLSGYDCRRLVRLAEPKRKFPRGRDLSIEKYTGRKTPDDASKLLWDWPPFSSQCYWPL